MDVIKVCEKCKGAGFWRQEYRTVHPYQNVAHATAIYADGSKVEACLRYACRPLEEPQTLEFKCIFCNGSGEYMYRRGMSLVPLVGKPNGEE